MLEALDITANNVISSAAPRMLSIITELDTDTKYGNYLI
jgi:hypothetical protein